MYYMQRGVLDLYKTVRVFRVESAALPLATLSHRMIAEVVVDLP